MINILLLKLTAQNFASRLAHATLASKNDIATLVKRTDFDDKLKHLNKNVILNKNEFNELSKKVKAISTKGLTKDLIKKFSILNGAKYFSSGIFQNYLVFIPAKKYIKYFSGTTRINSWKSNEISEGDIESISKLDSNFVPTFAAHHVLPDINFTYFSYILDRWLRNSNTDFTLKNCVVVSAKLTKNADPDKYKYSG